MTAIPKQDKRVQFDVLPDRLKEFDQLMVFCDVRTRRELFDHAMTLFEWAVHEVRSGNEIAAFNKQTDDVSVVKFPVLDNAARRKANFRIVETTSNEYALSAKEAVSLKVG